MERLERVQRIGQSCALCSLVSRHSFDESGQPEHANSDLGKFEIAQNGD